MNARIVSFLRFASLVYLVFLIPKVISFWGERTRAASEQLQVFLGVENLIYSQSGYKSFKNLRCGLICDKNSFDQSRNRTADLLKKNGFSLKKMFVLGSKGDQETNNVFATTKGRDRSTGVPLYFLYRKRSSTVDRLDSFLKRNSQGIEAFFVDLHNGAASEKILKHLFVFAATSNKKIIVLDRPNPLGKIIEGPGKIPWRHGLTIGELAIYMNRYLAKRPANVTVVPMKRWRRDSRLFADAKDRAISQILAPLRGVKPVQSEADNMGSYQFLLLKDREKLSRWEIRYLKRICWHLGFHCYDCSKPNENGRGLLEGVKLSLKKDVSSVSAFNSLLTITRFLKNREQIKLSFDDSFDEEFGSDDVRKFLEGHLPFDSMKKKIKKSLADFYDKSKYCCLYKPMPVLVDPEIVKV